MKINVVARSVQCGHMITILTGKTPGSTYMAGVVDNIRKEVIRHHITWQFFLMCFLARH